MCTIPVRKRLRVEEARDGQDAAGQPDETDGDPGCSFTHPRSQWVDNGDVTIETMKQRRHMYVLPCR